MLGAREEECAKLRLENNDIVMRLLEDKASMVAEMNKMNDMVQALNKQVLEHKAAEARALGGARAGGRSALPDLGFSDFSDGDGTAIGSGWSMGDECPPPEKLRFTIKAHHTEANCVCYSKSEPLLFTGASDGMVKAWEAVGGKGRATLRGADHAVLALDSSDGSLAGATDRTVKMWDLKTERVKATVTGHSNKVHAVRFSPDGRQVFTGSTDRTIKVSECHAAAAKSRRWLFVFCLRTSRHARAFTCDPRRARAFETGVRLGVGARGAVDAHELELQRARRVRGRRHPGQRPP